MPGMETLNLNVQSVTAPAPPIPPAATERKNPTLAWLLSFVCPGAGQLYCRNEGRGLVTLVLFWIAAAVTFSVKPPALAWGIALRYGMALWSFATLDAFFSAREINAGIAPLLEGANPRVAAILNLTTKGWGYFYLGRKGEGLGIFILLMIADGASRTLNGQPRLWASGLTEIVMICLCVHGYLLGRNQLKAVLPAKPPVTTEGGLSVGVPITCGAFVAASYLMLAVVGLLLPNYEPIDESRAVVEKTSVATIYRNPKYKVSIEFPPGWELSYPTPKEFVMGVRPGGGCVVQFMAAAELPFVTRQADVRETVRVLTPKGYVYEQERSTELGGFAASEVTFRHKRDEGEIDQTYLYAKNGLSSYILVTSTNEEVRSKCEALSEQIRSKVKLP